MNVINEISRINELELQNGVCGTNASWHSKYARSAWVYIGNLPNSLSEGDVLCVMSQFGEVEDVNLARDEDTGKSRGFCFLKYEDARSCVLAVDNLTGSKVLGRPLRVDHCEKYRLPKHLLQKEEEGEEETPKGPGHAYKDVELANGFDLSQGQDLFAPPPPKPPAAEKETPSSKEQRQKKKELKRKKKEEQKEQRRAEREERKKERAEKRREREIRRSSDERRQEEHGSKKKRKHKHERDDRERNKEHKRKRPDRDH